MHCALALAVTIASFAVFTEVARDIRFYIGEFEQEAIEPRWVIRIFNIYFSIYFLGSVFPFILFLIWLWRDRSVAWSGQDTPFVSIIIPAFNEEANVTRSVAAALRQNYPAYEVIVLDDGSQDHTPYLLESAGVPLVRLRSNLGKAHALNAGLQRGKGDVLVFSDADSALDPDAARRLVGRFAEPAVGAVAGQVMVVDRPDSMLRRWQMIEYIYGQVIVKAAQAGNRSSALICPGPVCAFRRSVLLRLGGFKDDTLVEDFDATLEAIRTGHRVAYEPRAIARTEVPLTWKELHRQRLRWTRGTLQVLRKHRQMLFDSRYGRIGSFWLPFCLLMSLFSPAFDLLVLLTVPVLLVASNDPVAAIKTGCVLMIMMEIVILAQYCIATLMIRGVNRSVIPAIASIRIFNLFLGVNRIGAIWAELRGSRPTW